MGERNFAGAKANHRCGFGRSLVVLLLFGGSRQNHSGTESSDDSGSDEADLWKDTAKPHRPGDRNTFALGEPAANGAGAGSARGARTNGKTDNKNQRKR